MPGSDDLVRLTLVEVADRIREGELSPVEVARASLDRTEQLNPLLNAAVAVLADQAIEAARKAEREIAAGDYRGPLHGVPIGIKDLADVAGVTTAAGSHLFDDRVPSADAALVRQLRSAGAIITTKLNCDEFAYHPTGATSQYGPTANPWDAEIVTGGSSSGTGAAVASGMVYGGLGTDTGGSIRIPSACCGLVGIKPTYARVSLEGVVLLSPSFDTPGPMARTTLDAAVLLRAMADPVREEEVREPNRVTHITGEIDAGLEGLRVGIPTNYFFDDLDPEINAAVCAAIDALATLGADLVQIEIPAIDQMVESQHGILVIEADRSVRAVTGGSLAVVNATLRARLESGVDRFVRPGGNADAVLGRLRAMRDDALASYRRTIGRVDVLVAPALRRSPPRIEDALTDFQWMADLTRPFNCSQQPVVCMPVGWTEAGLPIGLQIVATKYRERTALRVAHALEQSEHAPERRWPEVAAPIADPPPSQGPQD